MIVAGNLIEIDVKRLIATMITGVPTVEDGIMDFIIAERESGNTERVAMDREVVEEVKMVIVIITATTTIVGHH